MALTIFIKFCEFIEYSKATNWHYRILSENSLKLKKINFLYFAWSAILTTEKVDKSNRDHKLLIIENYTEIHPVVLQL